MLGTALQTALASQYEIIRLVRRPANAGEVEWHPEAPRPLIDTSALEGLSAAIHLSGANVADRRWTPAYKQELIASRVDSTRALAKALANLSQKPQTLLVASGAGIYGNRGEEILDESSPDGTGFLANLCRAWENAAEPAQQAGIRVANLRCGVVIGKGGALAKMLPIFRFGLGGPLGNGKQWMSWIALADLIAAVQFVLENETLTGPVNLVSSQPVTNAEFTHALAAALHRPAILPAPAIAMRLAFGQMADEALLASARVLPKKLTNAKFLFQQANFSEALQAAL